LESGSESDDVFFQDLPELNQDTVVNKPNYDFLEDEEFWQEVKKIASVPGWKSCSNTESYAHFGIARLVYEKIYGDLRLLPFGNQKRYVPFFEEYPEDTTPYEVYLTTELMKRLNEITRFTKQELNVPLTLTSLTLHSGEKHDRHCRHRSGTVMDIRPFPATRPMTWRDSVYDYQMNLRFTRFLLAHKDVTVVFFNDPRLHEDSVVKSIIQERQDAGNPVLFRQVAGHDNHYHIEFRLDSEVDLVTRYIKSQVDFR